MRRDLLLIVAVLLLLGVPFWLTVPHDAGKPGESGASFTGTDEQARTLISRLAPDYQPWVAPHVQPPSGEVECLLFALQAALGAAVIGYWLGSAVTRRRLEQDRQAGKGC